MGCWGGCGGRRRCREGVLVMEGVKGSDVGYGSPVGMGAQGGSGGPRGDVDGDVGPMGCWMYGWRSQTYRVLG